MSQVRPALAILAAIARNGVIGRSGTLPWHLPRDLARFKKISMGHAIIMGRKTFDSIGRALPGRRSIVISRQSQRQLPVGVTRVGSLDEAIEEAASDGASRLALVIGGRAVYAAALPLAAHLYLTRVEAEVAGDVLFPEVDWNEWECQHREHHPADARNEYDLSFELWRRRPPAE